MKTARMFPRRLAAGLAALSLGVGLAVSCAGVAQAAVPDHWGFAFVSQPAVPGTPSLAHQAGSWTVGVVKTTPGVVGQVFVRFPNIAAKAGIVHVTAVTDERPIWCQAQKWGPSGPNEIVAVRCYRASAGPATPVFVPFTVMFTTSSKGPFPAGRGYGFVHFQPGPGVVASFNSSGGANTVTPGPVGVWIVHLNGLGSAALTGGVQVTAVNPTVPAKCEVSGWASGSAGQALQIRCYNGMSTPLKTGWTLSYQRGRAITGAQPKLFGYTFDNMPLLAGPYAPAPPVNFNSAGGVNTIRSAGAGLRLVQFPHVAALPDTVLVTPFKTGPGFCNLVTLWATGGPPTRTVLVRDVACYTAVGMLKSQASLVTYTSSR